MGLMKGLWVLHFVFWSTSVTFSELYPDPSGPTERSWRSECLFQQTVGLIIMAKAIWNGQLLAESEKFETVEGNVYFPEEAVKREFLRPSTTTSSCPWKGQARYYSLLVDGQENPDAAWYYPDPKPAARNIKHHIAFWRGVEVSKD